MRGHSRAFELLLFFLFVVSINGQESTRRIEYLLFPHSSVETAVQFQDEAASLRSMQRDAEGTALAFHSGTIRPRRVGFECGNEFILRRPDGRQTMYWNTCGPSLPRDYTVSALDVLGTMPAEEDAILIYFDRWPVGSIAELLITGDEIVIPTEYSPVVAPRDGTVTDEGVSTEDGVFVVVDHGEFRIRYKHLQRTFVTVGSTVELGELIAESGFTGPISIPQLALEIERTGPNAEIPTTIIFISL